MYFTDISNTELQYFRNLKVPNFTIKLSDILHQTSGSYDNKLFKIEEIITGSIYKIFPMFYTGEITSSNANDKIIDNKVIVCKKEIKETYITFISNPDEPVQDYISYASYFSIEDSLTTSQFNSIVDLFRANTVHSDSFNIKQGLVVGDWGEYTFDIDSTTIVDNGILITDETLTNLGTVTLTNPKFHYTTYTLKLKVYHMTDINIGDTSSDNIVVQELTVVLEEDKAVTIPFNTLDYSYVVGFDAVVEIRHDIPVIPDVPKSIYLSSDKNIIQTGEKSDITATVKDLGGVLVGANHDIYFYEAYEPTLLTLTSNKSIMQTGDTADIKATLKDEDGSLIADEDIYFYKAVDYLFKYRGLSSTSTIDDPFVSQTGTSAVSSTVTDSGTTFTTASTNAGFIWANLYGTTQSTTEGDYEGDFIIECDVTNVNNVTSRIGMYEPYVSGATIQRVHFDCAVGHLKIIRNNNIFSFYVDDVFIESKSMTTEEKLRIGFVLDNGASVTFKNFIINGVEN